MRRRLPSPVRAQWRDWGSFFGRSPAMGGWSTLRRRTGRSSADGRGIPEVSPSRSRSAAPHTREGRRGRTVRMRPATTSAISRTGHVPSNSRTCRIKIRTNRTCRRLRRKLCCAPRFRALGRRAKRPERACPTARVHACRAGGRSSRFGLGRAGRLMGSGRDRALAAATCAGRAVRCFCAGAKIDLPNEQA